MTNQAREASSPHALLRSALEALVNNFEVRERERQKQHDGLSLYYAPKPGYVNFKEMHLHTSQNSYEEAALNLLRGVMKQQSEALQALAGLEQPRPLKEVFAPNNHACAWVWINNEWVIKHKWGGGDDLMDYYDCPAIPILKPQSEGGGNG